MDTRLARLRPFAIVCALLFLLCVIISHPVAEIGIDDDWSYVYSAKLFAETGHIHYIGWASAMLGWMIPLGALFVRIFGFSFTAVRAAGILIATLNAFLLQRCFVRAGLNEWNATLASLTILLSPLYIPLASVYMTDIAGMFVTLICFYACLRAVQSSSTRAATLWIVLACVLDIIGGTARQTAWLGLLIMVPSACWLLRRRPLPWLAIGLCWIACVAGMYACLHWFGRQPYSLREALVAGHLDRDLLEDFVGNVFRAALALILFLAPLLIALIPQVHFRDATTKRYLLLSALGIAIVSLVLAKLHLFQSWLAPFDGNFVTENGFVDLKEFGTRGTVLGPWVRACLTVLTLVCAAGLIAFIASLRHSPSRLWEVTAGDGRNFTTVAVLLLPFAAVYTSLMLHRALFASLVDRYLLIPMFVLTLLLGLLYQKYVHVHLPVACLFAASVFGAYSVAANHDLFAMQRARVKAADELEANGVRRDAIFGGWEFDGWTQVERFGWVNSAYMNMPTGFSADQPIKLKMAHPPCGYGWSRIFPAIQPRYALSFDPTSCDGPAPIPAVPIRSWLPPYNAKIYIDRVHGRVY